MTSVERLAYYCTRAFYEALSPEVRAQLQIRVLDSIGCAIGALGAQPMRAIRELVNEFDDAGLCTMIGGGRTPPDRAAFYNSALVRYLDFNDSYLAKVRPVTRAIISAQYSPHVDMRVGMLEIS
jgi:2-methylcitrate dehydratase